jgi:nucleoside-diphosphate-sugar epimerase
VLVTGATGFLGAALVRALVSAGVRVAATRRQNSTLDRLAGIAGLIEFFDTGDTGLSEAIQYIGPGAAIVHAATCYGRKGESWGEIAEANTCFPLRLLNKAMAGSIPVFINIDTVLTPKTNAYALSKHQFAQWGRLAAAQKDEFRFVNVRLEHIYGPGDDPSKFITQIVRRCLANEAVIPLTKGEQRRDFISVDDAVAALQTLLDSALDQRLPAGWSEFDLGSGETISIRELVELIHRLTESNAGLKFGVLPYRANEMLASVADISPLNELGWQCRVSLEQGLQQIINSERTL